MKYNTNSLLTESTQIKKFIEKNKKIPKTSTLSSGEILSSYSIAYLLCAGIHDKFQKPSYNLVNVRIYDPSKKHVDTINGEDVLKDDYLWMVNNFLNFCNKHHRVPRFVTTKNTHTKVSFELFFYCVAKIASYFKEKGKLPNYCHFNRSYKPNTATNKETIKKNNNNSTSSKTKGNNCSHPYTSSPNLPESERGQNTNYGCANNGQQKAFYKLTGKIFKESELAKLSGTTTRGTDHKGINTCIAAIAKKLGIKLTVKWVNFSSLGKTTDERFEALGKIICKSNKAVITHIAYMNGGEDLFDEDGVWFGHYEPIKSINTKTKTVKVLNSLGYKKASGGYKGHIQDRSFKVEASYLANTSGGQPSICIITRG